MRLYRTCHPKSVPFPTITCALLALAVMLCAPVAAAAEDPPQAADQRFVSIDFNNVDINVFIKFISELTGRNFVVDSRVRGKVTILSPTKISVAEAYRVFESVLEVHGFTTVKSGKVIKIVPAPDARSKNIETLLRQESGMPEDKVVTQLIPLRFADTEEIKRLFAPLVSKSSVILSYPPTNSLIVTDVYSNVLRLLRILEAIDIAGIGQEISVWPLENASAVEIVNILETVFKSGKKPKKGEPEIGIRFVADERTNTLVVMGSEDQTLKVRQLVDMLDRETPRSKEKIHVFYLEYAVAEDLAKVLQTLSTGQPASSQPAEGKKEAPLVSSTVQITADKATNSLIISAGKQDFVVLEEIIRKLDIPRSMVYIEALIMEVDIAKDFEIGTEWQVADTFVVDNKQAVGGGSFRAEESVLPGTVVLDGEVVDGDEGLPGGLPIAKGFTMGVFSEAVTISGITFPNIQAIFQAYKKDRDVHFLSTPQILTTDNEEAQITVGKNLPFQTTATTVASGNETFNSFEYRDVGKTLKIKPQISKDRMVRLNISLVVTALESSVDFKPTTLKRTVDTTVVVQDANTVVIGGLIDETVATSEQAIPCLGDIPLFKLAFGKIATADERTNLYIFLTPHVINTPEEAVGIYSEKRDEIERSMDGGEIPMYPGQPDRSGEAGQ